MSIGRLGRAYGAAHIARLRRREQERLAQEALLARQAQEAEAAAQVREAERAKRRVALQAIHDRAEAERKATIAAQGKAQAERDAAKAAAMAAERNRRDIRLDGVDGDMRQRLSVLDIGEAARLKAAAGDDLSAALDEYLAIPERHRQQAIKVCARATGIMTLSQALRSYRRAEVGQV